MMQKVPPAEVKRELLSRMEEVRRPGFLESRILPHLPHGSGNGTNGGWRTEVHQLDGTGAATLEMDLGGEKVFGKFFADDTGPLVFAKLQTLRANGFGPGERYQVVEPLEFIPEYRLLLTRGARGKAVSESIGGDWDGLESGAVESARWLAKFHSSPMRIGKPRSLAASSELLSVARRLAKVVNRSPGHLKTADCMIREIERLAEDTVDVSVQGQGQYRPIHVFVGDEAVTVIDVDRSRPYDPAYDVTEFLVRMRKSVFKSAGSVEPAEAPTRAFLDTYASAVPDRSYLANLPFHYARFTLHGLNGEMKNDKSGDPKIDRTIAFHHSEFEGVLEGRFGF